MPSVEAGLRGPDCGILTTMSQTTKLFSELGLSPEVLKAIDKLGFEQAAPIQAEAIPILLQGKDVVGQSQTGSGKTAAFAIPAIEKADPQRKAVQVLIMCPTRELAIQVAEEVHKLALFKRGLHALPIYGGQSYERQFYGLKQGAQIVIGTPGRIMDHLRRKTLHLDAVQMVVLDEADVMLDMGFREDIELILQSVPKERQTVFFSATMPRPIQDLIQRYARDPVSVRIEQKTVTVPTVEQVYYEVDRRFKVELLTRLIDIHDYQLGIIFCNTKRMVDDLVDHLEAQGYSADRLHGDMTQGMRDRVMGKFRKSGLQFLVATDVAARGIDVDDVQVVFNYDLPYDAQDYVHRIGRTGRAGRSGRAISFVAGRELFQIQHIERFTRTRVYRGKIPTLDEVEDARASVFLDRLRTTLQSGQYQKQDHLIERLLEEGFSSTDIASALIHHLQKGEESAEAHPADATPARGRQGDQRPMPPRASAEGTASREGAPAPTAPATRPSPVRPKPIATPPKSISVPPAGPTAPRAPIAATASATPPAARVKSVAPIAAPASSPARVKPTVASATPPPPPPSPKPAAQKMSVAPVQAPKHTPPPPQDHIRLHVNLGAEMGATPGSLAQTIAGQTGLPSTVLGTVEIRDRYSFIDVATEHAKAIVAKLNRSQLNGRKLRVKIA